MQYHGNQSNLGKRMTKSMTFGASDDLAARIDEARGDTSRNQWLKGAIEAYLKGPQGQAAPPTPPVSHAPAGANTGGPTLNSPSLGPLSASEVWHGSHVERLTCLEAEVAGLRAAVYGSHAEVGPRGSESGAEGPQADFAGVGPIEGGSAPAGYRYYASDGSTHWIGGETTSLDDRLFEVLSAGPMHRDMAAEKLGVEDGRLYPSEVRLRLMGKIRVEDGVLERV